MAGTIPSASLGENLSFNLGYAIPISLQGAFTRSRFWVTLFAKLLRDPMSVRRVQRMRRKHASDYLFLRLGTTRTLLVLDRDGIRRVLDRSPDLYGPPKPKLEGMVHFQPGAVTISVDEAWRVRRRFNEAVLDSGRSLHRDAGSFLEVVRREVAASGPPRVWDDFDRLFERITLQVIFGPAARDDTALTGMLQAMLRESNRSFSRKRKSKHFDPFYARIRHHLAAAAPGSLAARCREAAPSDPAPTGDQTKVENQIPHWMFAMWETLATNTARALALIASHPDVERRVRQELTGARPPTADGIDRLGLLEGCVQEAMRLWPTTPMLLRELRAPDTLGGAEVPAGTQVLILNSFNHRDGERSRTADTFSPESWSEGRPDPLFNHLSSGTQVCAGQDLALFLAKAVLATLLEAHRFTLREPGLDPGRPLPYSFNYFRLRFDVAAV